MSIWDILEIDPTSEKSVIKKAFAKKLKHHHPEDDPQSYQRLREAYDAAMEEAENVIDSPTTYYDEEVEQERESSPVELEQNFFRSSTFFDTPLEVMEEELHPVHEFLQQVENLYKDFDNRIKRESWQALLNKDIVWEIAYSQQLRNSFLSFLEDNHHLPRPVWGLLDKTFGFREHKEELVNLYGVDFIAYIVAQIEGTMELRYNCFFYKKIEFDIEHYLDLRQAAQDMLMQRYTEKAGELLTQANELFADDPDLQLMRGKYYQQIKNSKAALRCFNHAITLEPEDTDGYWQRALLYYDQQEYESALADCMHLLHRKRGDKDQNVLVLAGRCHVALGNTTEGRELINDSSEIDHRHIRTCIHWSIAMNPHLHGEIYVDPKERRGYLFIHALQFIRLTWLYIFLYFLVSVIFDLKFTGLLIILLLWNAWKLWKVRRVLST